MQDGGVLAQPDIEDSALLPGFHAVLEASRAVFLQGAAAALDPDPAAFVRFSSCFRPPFPTVASLTSTGDRHAQVRALFLPAVVLRHDLTGRIQPRCRGA